PYLVAGLRAHLVVRHELRRTTDVAAVPRVLHEPVHADDHGLLHLVARDDAHLLPAGPALGGRLDLGLILVSHLLAPRLVLRPCGRVQAGARSAQPLLARQVAREARARLLGGAQLARPNLGFDLRQVLARRLDLVHDLGVAELLLEAEPEELLAQLAALLEEGVVRQLANLLRLHTRPPSSSLRETNFVLIGSFCAARRIASRAVVSSTPSISKSTRPGLT